MDELESAVSKLSEAELGRFAKWFAEFAADQWDQQIERDIQKGRFDAAGRRADKNFEAGHCKPL